MWISKKYFKYATFSILPKRNLTWKAGAGGWGGHRREEARIKNKKK